MLQNLASCLGGVLDNADIQRDRQTEKLMDRQRPLTVDVLRSEMIVYKMMSCL